MKRNQKNLKAYQKICREIWEERGPKCQDCGAWCGHWDSDLGEQVPNYHNFHHTEGRITKALDKDSIRILCFGCHAKDHGQRVNNSEWLR